MTLTSSRHRRVLASLAALALGASLSACGGDAEGSSGGDGGGGSATIDIVGFSDPTTVGTVVAGFRWSFTVLSIFLFDRVGCRGLLLWTMWGMPVCLVRGSSPQLHSTRHADSAADQR